MPRLPWAFVLGVPGYVNGEGQEQNVVIARACNKAVWSVNIFHLGHDSFWSAPFLNTYGTSIFYVAVAARHEIVILNRAPWKTLRDCERVCVYVNMSICQYVCQWTDRPHALYRFSEEMRLDISYRVSIHTWYSNTLAENVLETAKYDKIVVVYLFISKKKKSTFAPNNWGRSSQICIHTLIP